MKKIFFLISVLVTLFIITSCGDKKKSVLKETVTQEISAEEGGTIESSDGKISIEVPDGAMDSDVTITMKIYESANYPGTENETVISNVVEFEPSGMIFKKPVFISMESTGTENNLRAVKKKVIAAAVYKEKEKVWSYSPVGAAVKISGTTASGDPIMTTASGDPIMLNASGDPIMMSAGGDPIMLSASGDPIMVTASGDPIMNSAAGDPIMMVTGHFTAYTFIVIEKELEESEELEELEESEDMEYADDDDAGPDDDEDKVEEPVSVAECGNGIVEEGEECDSGADNGRFFCDYGEKSCELCSLSCKLEQGITSYCGDGSIDSLEGETCDDGADNGKYAHCNATCSGPSRYCGDGNVDEDEGEICDDGTDNDTYGHCNAWCDGPAPYCGDGSIDSLEGETCDDGADNGKYAHCNATCSGPAPYCGDGTKQDNEECDLGENNGKTDCASGETECVLCTKECRFKCKENYTLDGSQCVANSQTATCTDLPENAEWNSVSEITQTWSGTEWLPATTASFSEEASTTECRFKCKENYTWNNSRCVADSQTATCTDLPENAEWNSVSEITQTWSGTEWLPATTASFGEEASTTECRFKCNENYTWNNSQCVANSQTAICTDLPENAEWNSVSEVTQTWSGTEWLPATTASFGEEASTTECRFKCKDNFFWNGDACVDPCESNPCNEGYCIPVSATEFTCSCDEGYAWGGGSCFPECGPESDFPCMDPANSLVWSSRETSGKNWSEAVTYCENELTEGGYTDWRLPTINELRTVIVNCPGSQAGGACAISEPDYLAESDRVQSDCACEGVSGNNAYYYSKFGNDTQLWSSSDFAENDVYAWRVYFNEASLNVNVKNENYYPVRCVRDGRCADGYAWGGDKCLPKCSPETGDAVCIDSEHQLIWSKLATEKKEWGDAGSYCETLDEDGYTDWRLPNIDELRTVIVNCSGSQAGGACVISDPDHLSFSERIDADCSCSPGSNFSLLGDGSDINLWSSSPSIETDDIEMAWLVGFYRGNVNHSLISESNHIRCVR